MLTPETVAFLWELLGTIAIPGNAPDYEDRVTQLRKVRTELEAASNRDAG